MRKTAVLSLAAAAGFACAIALAAGPDPTVQQIYQAAASGHLAQAEQMVGQVLQDHPRSGKAHYVAAEVYARAGDFSAARRELGVAQRLEPGLAFAQPQSVRALEAELAQGRFVQRAQRMPYAPYAYPAPHRSSNRSWGLVLLLIAAAVILWALVRRRRHALYPPYPGQPGMPPTHGVGPVGLGGGVVPPYPYGYGGGPGSGLMSHIGTGLAMGAGMAGGEALVDRMMSGSAGGTSLPQADGAGPAEPPANGDMGGGDFGVSDPGSWDDGGADPGGGDDFGAGGDGWT